MNTFDETKLIMKKYDIHPNKNLGQNFLFDETSLNIIAEGVTKNDTVIEIGPGLGSLTKILLEKAKKVIVIELDSKMIEIIEDRFQSNNNIEIINEDILKVDLDNIINNEFSNDKSANIKIVANLPYYITTAIITKLLASNVNDITILIQKEVADRICAIPGEKEAGAITYFVNYYADAKKIGEVSSKCFIPNPKVESSIIRLQKLEKTRVEVKNEDMLFELIKSNFSKRRKTILNSLSNVIQKDKLKEILDILKIPENVRGESLSLEMYAKITNLYFDIK